MKELTNKYKEIILKQKKILFTLMIDLYYEINWKEEAFNRNLLIDKIIIAKVESWLKLMDTIIDERELPGNLKKYLSVNQRNISICIK
jgi:predicted RNA-binding protein